MQNYSDPEKKGAFRRLCSLFFSKICQNRPTAFGVIGSKLTSRA